MIKKEIWRRLWNGMLLVDLEVIQARAEDSIYIGNPAVRMLYHELLSIPRTSRSEKEMEMRAGVLLVSMSRIIQSLEN